MTRKMYDFYFIITTTHKELKFEIKKKTIKFVCFFVSHVYCFSYKFFCCLLCVNIVFLIIIYTSFWDFLFKFA